MAIASVWGDDSSENVWLAVDKVIHHDDVMFAIIILPRGNVAGFDPDRRDTCVVELDTEEGQASIAWRGRDRTAKYQLTAAVEILDQRAALLYFPSIWLVNVCEDRAESSDRCQRSAVATG